jgi:hypothetical protein
MPATTLESETILSLVLERLSATQAEVAEALGCTAAEATAFVDALVTGGWLERWSKPGPGRGPAVTLTPWSAERLGVRLNDHSSRWVPRSSRLRPTRARLKRHTVPQFAYDGLGRGSVLHRQRDHRQHEPWVEVAAAELVELALRRGDYSGDYGREGLPVPTFLLGLALPWDRPEITTRRRRCRTCGGRRLRPTAYCLRCDNWGLHRLVPSAIRRAARIRKGSR